MTSDVRPHAVAAMLASASGADKEIDRLIARAFHIEAEDFTSSAETARKLVAQVMPGAILSVGYDVRGILPSATTTLGKLRATSVAPTVPLAILQSMFAVLVGTDE